METTDFAYELPPELIAQTPIEPRDASRLLVVDRASGQLTHRIFRDIGEYLRPGDLLVANESRVIPARLHARKVPTGGKVELLKESVLRLAPVGYGEAERMIEELRGHELLRGFRGMPPADVESLADAIVRLSILVHDNPQIAELDINPLIATPEGAFAVDCRIVLRAKSEA